MSTSISDGQVKPCNADNFLYFSRSILRVGHSLWRSEFTRITIPLISQLNLIEIAVTGEIFTNLQTAWTSVKIF